MAYALFPFQQRQRDPLKLREKEKFEPQTVGSYARAVVKMYMQASGYSYGIEGYRDQPGFDHYWAARKDRTHSLGWFKVALQRDSQGISPDRQDRLDEVAALRKRIDALPSPDREWILLALATPWEGGEPESGGAALAPEADLVAAAKRLGPLRVMTLLRREKISEDPDMQLLEDGSSPAYKFDRVALFLLRHARDTLRPNQANRLLELEQMHWNRMRIGQFHFVTPRWAIAAADLQPERSSEILRAAMHRFSKGESSHDQDNRNMIAVALWEHEGEQAIPMIADWFFQETPSRGAIGFGRHRMANFLGAPERKALLKALLGDARLKELDWNTLERVARSANKLAAQPVIGEDELRKARHPLGSGHYPWQKEKARAEYPKETEALEARLAQWRSRLKAFAEEL